MGAAGALLAGCAQGDLLPETCKDGARAVLPVTMVGRAPMADVVVNDRAARFLLDTGAERSVVASGLVTILGLEPMAGPPALATAIGGIVQRRQAVIGALRLGDFTLRDFPILTGDANGFDGILGLDILSHYDVEVNLPAARVVLHAHGVCPGQRPGMAGPVQEMPARRMGGGGRAGNYLVVGVRLDDVETVGFFDTGAMAGSLVSSEIAARAGVGAAALAADRVQKVGGFGTTTALPVHRFRALVVGGEAFLQPSLLVGGFARAAPVVLGADYFQHHVVWFNFVGDRVFTGPLPAR